MSKLTKLIKTPKAFVKDAVKNRMPLLEYTPTQSSKSQSSQQLPMSAQENITTTIFYEEQIDVSQQKTLESIIEETPIAIAVTQPPIDEFALLQEYYIGIRENLSTNKNNIQEEILSNDFFFNLLLAVKKFNIHHHHVFNNTLMTKFLAAEKPIKEKTIDSLVKSSKLIDHLNITVYMDYLYNKDNINSYSQILDKIINFTEQFISSHPNRTMLLGEDNLATLNSTSINPQLCDFYLSNYMLYALIENKISDMNLLRNKDDLYWWWLTYYLPTKKLNSKFIPIEVISYFKDITFMQNDLRIGLPRFFHKIYEKNNFYKGRYNILNSVDFLAYLMDCYLNNMNNPINNIFINDHVEPLLEKIIYKNDETGQEYSIFDLLCYISYTSDFKLENISSDILELTRKTFLEGLPKHTHSNFFNNLIIQKNKIEKEEGKVRLIGLYHSYTGLGSNLKMMSNALKNMQIPHEIYDIETKKTYQISCPVKYQIEKNCNIFMINADMIPPHILDLPQDDNSINIGFLLWELEEVPYTHQLALDFLDEIWVPTHYLEDIYKKKTETPVVCVKKHIDLIPPTKKYKATKKFRFYMSFDFHSNIERKNPLAAVIAFKKAFTKDEPVQFILKTTDIIRNHPGNHKQQWERILREISNDSRFKILSGKIPFQDLVNQINNVECIVSSHRSEGFGYLPAHAFILGKPVIVTDYSGTTDFCTHQTSYPTKWSKKLLDRGDFGETISHGFWADVDVNDLAKNMYDVYANYPKALNKAYLGKKLIETEYSFEKFSQNCYIELEKLHIVNSL